MQAINPNSLPLHPSRHKTHHIWINGRFLGRKVTGVERVASEILAALSITYLNKQGLHQGPNFNLQFHWAVPKDYGGLLPIYGADWPAHVIGTLDGHAWEQWSLARHRPQDWLINLCNTAPLLRSKQVIFFHDAQVFALPDNFTWRFRLWYKCLLNIAGRRARVLLTNSVFSQQQLAKYTGINAEKFRVIHLGVDHMLRLTPSLPTKVKQLEPNKPWVLAVSSASPNKNFAGALKAATAAGVHLVIAGQTHSKVFTQITIDRSKVTEVGYISDEELAGLYANASCLLYPSFYEGFGLPPLEAMLMGCPVVVSQTSSMPEVCGTWARYCEPGNSDSIQQALEEVLAANPEARQSIKMAGKEHASQFTWQRSAQALWDQLITSITHEK